MMTGCASLCDVLPSFFFRFYWRRWTRSCFLFSYSNATQPEASSCPVWLASCSIFLSNNHNSWSFKEQSSSRCSLAPLWSLGFTGFYWVQLNFVLPNRKPRLARFDLLLARSFSVTTIILYRSKQNHRLGVHWLVFLNRILPDCP